MIRIKVNYDERCISVDDNGKMSVKISNSSNNGLSYDSEGKIIVTKGIDGENDTGGTMNIPGNAIDGEVGEKLDVIRCASFVSMKTDKPSGYTNIHSVINQLIG